MKGKELRKTGGLPAYLGAACGVLLLINTVISINISPIISSAVLKSQNMSVSVNSSVYLANNIISYIVYPGIFLILLFMGMNKYKRGKAFGIVWIVFSCLSLVSSFGSLALKSETTIITKNIIDTLVPGGMALYTAVSLLGSALMLASCIVFLRRFKTPAESGGA